MTKLLSGRGRIVLAVAVLGVATWVLTRPLCLSAYLLHGVDARQCPDGEFRQTVWANVSSVQRGKWAYVGLGARAHYAVSGQPGDREGFVHRFRGSLALVDGSGKETPLELEGSWTLNPDGHYAKVKFPSVPDGDYKVRARVESDLGKDEVDVPLALYAPARVHVITDRPLYQPGDLIKFRAVVLRARDLAPLDGRPGHWEVRDPTGELMLEERAPARDWGVVAGTFPLDHGAPQGAWRVAWVSGDARDEVSVKVEPFVLPRFRIDASSSQPFFRAHDKPVIKGHVVYSSGAPVANASVDVTWSVGGSWPPPNGWLDRELPRHATTDKDGAFTLTLPAVPADLQGQAPLTARLSATDASGDRVEGAATALLSEDAISVSTVTELADGIVEGFNNRVFLRATTAAGQVLPNTELVVKRAWDPGDEGVTATTDADGVAQLQLDPGPPVNVVIPPQPYRPPPPKPVAQITGTENLLDAADEVPLADQSALEHLLPALEPCARFASGESGVQVGLVVDPSGSVRARGNDGQPLSTCAAAALENKKLAAGKLRLYRVDLQFSDHALPQAEVVIEGVPLSAEAVQAQLSVAVQNARACLPRRTPGREAVSVAATWQVQKGQKGVSLLWADARGTSKLAEACLQSRLGGLQLAEPVKQDLVGVAHVSISPSAEEVTYAPQATTMLGYELKVIAREKGKELGSTTLRMKPGAVPPLRIRAEPVLAEPGATVDVELVRGPNFRGEIPEEAYLYSDRGGDPIKAKVDRDLRKTSFQLPRDAGGWYRIDAGSVHALVFVRSQSELTVAMSTDRERYAPGQKARLALHTRIGGKGAAAAVGLIGVDESLAQLASLPGPDELARVNSKVTMSAPAFGTLDGEALTLGRIRGSNAAMATVMRVTALPTVAELDGVFNGNQVSTFDPDGELTDRFYDVLGELHAVTREWEDKAAKGEKMKLPKMAELWNTALANVKARGGKVEDAYGRPLRLAYLPHELLAMVDPQVVVIDGSHKTEDVENWAAYVAKERP